MRRLRALGQFAGFTAAVLFLSSATARATTPTPTSPPPLTVQAIPNPARVGDVVTLSANPRFGAPAWRQIDGPSVTLHGEDMAQTTFVAPAVGKRTTLVFRFTAPPDGGYEDVAVDMLPAHAVIVTIPETEGAPGRMAEVGVILDPVRLEVTELHHRLHFEAAAAVADRGDGTPDCNVAADFDTASFTFLPEGCVATNACTQVRADVDFEPTRTTAREAYRCRIAVSGLPADTCQHPLTCAGGTAESAAGAPLQLTCTDGAVTSRYDYPDPIFTLRTDPATPQVGADFLAVFSIDQLFGGLAQASINGLWPLIESVSVVPDTGIPGQVAYTLRPLLAGTAYPGLGVGYEVTGGCPGNEFFYFRFAHSQQFPVPIQDPHGVRVSGRVAEFPGCQGAMRAVEVQMEPGRYSARSDLGAGEFSFAGVSPGNYGIGVRPACNDFGCWPDVSVHVGSADVFITLCPQTLACTGDCDGDRRVTIDELIRGVGMALDMIEPAPTCGSLDIDASGLVQINELITAVNAALEGCSGVNTTTPTPTPAAAP